MAKAADMPDNVVKKPLNAVVPIALWSEVLPFSALTDFTQLSNSCRSTRAAALLFLARTIHTRSDCELVRGEVNVTPEYIRGIYNLPPEDRLLGYPARDVLAISLGLRIFDWKDGKPQCSFAVTSIPSVACLIMFAAVEAVGVNFHIVLLCSSLANSYPEIQHKIQKSFYNQMVRNQDRNRDKDNAETLYAMRILAKYGNKYAQEYVFDTIYAQQDPAVRFSGLLALCATGNPKARQLYLEELRNNKGVQALSAIDRSSCIKRFAKAGDPDAHEMFLCGLAYGSYGFEIDHEKLRELALSGDQVAQAYGLYLAHDNCKGFDRSFIAALAETGNNKAQLIMAGGARLKEVEEGSVFEILSTGETELESSYYARVNKNLPIAASFMRNDWDYVVGWGYFSFQDAPCIPETIVDLANDLNPYALSLCKKWFIKSGFLSTAAEISVLSDKEAQARNDIERLFQSIFSGIHEEFLAEQQSMLQGFVDTMYNLETDFSQVQEQFELRAANFLNNWLVIRLIARYFNGLSETFAARVKRSASVSVDNLHELWDGLSWDERMSALRTLKANEARS